MNGVAEVYIPATELAGTFRVAPTFSVSVPPVSVPVGVGSLVHVSTVISLPPFEIVVAPAGSVIEYVASARPTTSNEAAVIVPALDGRNVTPPVAVRALAGVSSIVPAVAFTARLPKFMSTVLVSEIGARIVAEAVAEAVTCVKAVPVIRNIAITKGTTLINAFIIFKFNCLFALLKIAEFPLFLNCKFLRAFFFMVT